MEKEQEVIPEISLGLDIGVFSAKGVLIDNNQIKTVKYPTAGRPVDAAQKCLDTLLDGKSAQKVKIGFMGQNSKLVAESLGIKNLLEIEALQAGLFFLQIKANYVLSLGHENVHYLELDEDGRINFFSRNGQCAAGSGSFWYQQATRMGYNDRELAEIAVEAESAVPISGRCAVFAKSDMTHAINEGATQSAVSAGMGKALVENILTSVVQNRFQGPGTLIATGGVANNKAVIKYLDQFLSREDITLEVPEDHEYINAIGAAVKGTELSFNQIVSKKLETSEYVPDNPLPPLDPDQVCYLEEESFTGEFDLRTVYLGVDCGSVSTKCVLLDKAGRQIGGIYLPTTGRPALQVLELMKQVETRYSSLIGNAPIVACTTGSGRFLSQKILNADYAVDEITCQAEGIKSLFSDESTLSIIEIGGEDSKFIQLHKGILFDYNMNPVCAAGTGTFLENLAELLGISIKDEFSQKAFAAEYAVDLGDICTLISQSILASASARGLPLNEQLSSLAYSSAQNYLSKTVDKRTLDGRVVFAGATAKNHALAASLAAICKKTVYVPPQPELTGALGSALMAKQFHELGYESTYAFRNLSAVSHFKSEKKLCKAECRHEHNCMLNVISFSDGKKFIYGDRCGRYSSIEKKKEELNLPDYAARRSEVFHQAAGESKEEGPTVGIARNGLYFEYYPFWAVFFRKIGCQVVLSDNSTSDTLHKGKINLDSEMCYPMKVIIGHYQNLKEKNLDYIFLPEVVNMEAMPWAPHWPRSFVCPLLQTLRGTVTNSVNLEPDQVLYAQLNYKDGYSRIKEQLEPVAKKVLGEKFSEKRLEEAVSAAYRAQEDFSDKLTAETETMLEELKNNAGRAAVAFLSRSYTLYDQFISKKSMHHARQSGMMAVPHEYFTVYLKAWYTGKISSPYLDPYREEFLVFLKEQVEVMENIYPVQLQKILSAVILINFLNLKTKETGLSEINLIFLDPFKCGPNAMLRHFLSGLTSYLRLTLDEHTAPAGMITRLEAFRNTCLSKEESRRLKLPTSATSKADQKSWHKILIPEPSLHSRVFASLFKSYGVEAEVLPRGKIGDLSLAQRYVNGEECLPFIQNLQDYLRYLEENNGGSDKEVFFQGWACGPCRYGLYAPTQALSINKAGYGDKKVCAIKLQDITRRFGYPFVIGVFNAQLTIDILYKMLHKVRPYELESGAADRVFEHYGEKLTRLLENYKIPLTSIITGSYRKPLENLIREAAEDFSQIPVEDSVKPRILLGGEFYVRIDDRCNQAVIRKIENAGGEVSIAPVTELFTYTIYIMFHETRQAFRLKRKPVDYFTQKAYSMLLKIAQRDEEALENAAGPILDGLHEPAPWEIMEHAVKYVSKHYGGEPPMTIGRAAAFSGRERVAGAIFVAPFTCMPSSIVEAQQKPLQEELGIPIVTVYYDGKENTNRDEMVEGLVFQARQKLIRDLPVPDQEPVLPESAAAGRSR
ncbi:MAG: BadF/BadG/BcrA/BcrD ATPase family protein [Bacillota bacterium]